MRPAGADVGHHGGVHGRHATDTTTSARIRWIIAHREAPSTRVELTKPEATVTAAITGHLQHRFPSPRGIPVVTGSISDGEPVHLRIRAFPHGARVGIMRGATRERPIKPTLVGSLFAEGGSSVLTYAITSRRPALLALGWGTLTPVLLVAAGLAALASAPVVAWALVALAAYTGVVFASFVVAVDRAREEEAILRSWLDEVLG
jgi:hypothetical protein